MRSGGIEAACKMKNVPFPKTTSHLERTKEKCWITLAHHMQAVICPFLELFPIGVGIFALSLHVILEKHQMPTFEGIFH